PTQTAVRAVAFAADGRQLLTGSAGQALLAWDTDTWQEQARFVGHTGPITGLFVPGAAGQTLVSAAADGSVRFWPLSGTAVAAARFAGHESRVTSLALTPDGKKLVSGSWDGTVRVWDAATGESLAVLEGHESRVNAVAVSRDGQRAASAGGGGE